MSLKIYDLDPAKFISAAGVAWQTCFKKTNLKLDLLTDIDMLLTVKKLLQEEYLSTCKS